ncbi:hypothetical protein BJX99DRAFT_239580 [Aspergillus californicus]
MGEMKAVFGCSGAGHPSHVLELQPVPSASVIARGVRSTIEHAFYIQYSVLLRTEYTKFVVNNKFYRPVHVDKYVAPFNLPDSNNLSFLTFCPMSTRTTPEVNRYPSRSTGAIFKPLRWPIMTSTVGIFLDLEAVDSSKHGQAQSSRSNVL